MKSVDSSQAAGANGKPAFLTDLIVELGFVDATVVETAEQEARELGRSVTQVLLDKGELTDEQLARSIAARNGLEYVDLNGYDVDLGAAELIDASAARRYKAVPIAFDETGELVVAIADPVDALAVSDIAVITKAKVRTVVAAESAIKAVIAYLPQAAPPPPRATDESLAEDDRRKHEDAGRVVPPGGAGEDDEEVPEPVETAQPVVDAIGDTREQATSGADAANGSNRLQERIIHLVESALDGAAESEVGTLEAELTQEQQARGILEAELDAERQAREALQAELDAEREARDALAAELEREREVRSTETEALIAERDECARERDELEHAIRERIAMASQKSTELEALLAELQVATTRDVGPADPDA